MWLGSVNKGIFYRDSTGKWTTLSKAVTGATSDQVFDIQIGFGSTVYIATYIEVLEFDGTTWKRYGKNTVGDKALKGNPIWSIQEDKKGNIWALSSKFLHKIAKDGTWSYIDLDKEIGSSDNYYGFAFDSKNNFMLHNYSGLERGIWNEQLNKYTFAYATNAVGYSYIKGIYDKNDILWLAGEADAKGINWYNGGKKVNLYYKAGETPQEIKSMVIDPLDNNKIWTGDYYAFGVYEITTNTVAAKDMLPLLAELKAYQNNQELLVSWSGIYTKQQISLFDMNGRAIAQTTLNDGEQVTQFTVTDFPSGIYALRLSSKEGEQTIKIAITHK
jgi:hypothetical protein